jgi:hypothetical protein
MTALPPAPANARPKVKSSATRYLATEGAPGPTQPISCAAGRWPPWLQMGASIPAWVLRPGSGRCVLTGAQFVPPAMVRGKRRRLFGRSGAWGGGPRKDRRRGLGVCPPQGLVSRRRGRRAIRHHRLWRHHPRCLRHLEVPARTPAPGRLRHTGIGPLRPPRRPEACRCLPARPEKPGTAEVGANIYTARYPTAITHYYEVNTLCCTQRSCRSLKRRNDGMPALGL